MVFSRSARIVTLLVIDTLFFFLEIIVGYAVHSLALVADSFHMLNDVFSLIVALYAIRLAKSKTSSSKYTYGVSWRSQVALMEHRSRLTLFPSGNAPKF
jgi:solute carrier family 30 (zinc transporter), member 1